MENTKDELEKQSSEETEPVKKEKQTAPKKPAGTGNKPAPAKKNTNANAPAGKPTPPKAQNNAAAKKPRQPAATGQQKRPVPKTAAGEVPTAPKPLRPNTNKLKPKNSRQNSGALAAPKNNNSIAPVKKPAPPRAGVAPNSAKKLRIIPLGGLGEVGKNITAYEYGNDMFLVDVGLAFPNDEMLGVDIVIPDFTYVEKNKHRLRGIVITHGHEDHIGGLAYLLKKVSAPVYATKFTCGLIEGKLKEHGLIGKVKLNVVKPGNSIKLGSMSVEFIPVNHSIPDACALAITTPVGVIIQTGDFKIDYTPVSGPVTDLARLGAYGSKGVLALLSDSTNSEKPGTTASERTVGTSFDRLFHQAGNRRIIIATFASNVFRVQQVVDRAAQSGRKVALSGRSMINVCAKAVELGYLKDPEHVLIELDEIRRYEDHQLVVVTTGSQGEPMSALSRMASGDHRQLTASSNDFIIISATPIPGNENSVGDLVNDLMELGAEVIYERTQNIHVSGHACQDEQKLMLALTKPKFFMPVHGEYKHLKKHGETGVSMGVPAENIIIGENGDVVETDGETMKIVSRVQSGAVMVDGLGVGDVGSVVLRDRKLLSEDGLIIAVCTISRKTGKVVAGPDLVTRGFVYVRESDELLDEAKKTIKKTLDECADAGTREWGVIKNRLRDELGFFIFQKTKRRPMILPVIMEV